MVNGAMVEGGGDGSVAMATGSEHGSGIMEEYGTAVVVGRIFVVSGR